MWEMCVSKVGVEEFLSFRNEWGLVQSEQDWDISRESEVLEGLKLREAEASRKYHLLICAINCTDFDHMNEETLIETWACSKCGFERNEAGTSSCSMCRNPGKKWKCYGCSARNDFGVSSCEICCTSSSRSAAVKKYLTKLKNPEPDMTSTFTSTETKDTTKAPLPNVSPVQVTL